MAGTFLNFYTYTQMELDLSFVKKFRNLWVLFNTKEERIRHKAKYWACWLRYHRWLRIKQPTVYIFGILLNRDHQVNRAYDYINQKDNTKE